MLTVMLLVIVLLGAGIYYAHKRHMDALALIRVDLVHMQAWLYSKFRSNP